jgi:hypothetical protein
LEAKATNLSAQDMTNLEAKATSLPPKVPYTTHKLIHQVGGAGGGGAIRGAEEEEPGGGGESETVGGGDDRRPSGERRLKTAHSRGRKQGSRDRANRSHDGGGPCTFGPNTF